MADGRTPDAYGCDQPVFVLSLQNRLAELEARDTLEVVVRDADGEMRMVLDNVIARRA